MLAALLAAGAWWLWPAAAVPIQVLQPRELVHSVVATATGMMNFDKVAKASWSELVMPVQFGMPVFDPVLNEASLAGEDARAAWENME